VPRSSFWNGSRNCAREVRDLWGGHTRAHECRPVRFVLNAAGQ
jgi:hypothetical protein